MFFFFLFRRGLDKLFIPGVPEKNPSESVPEKKTLLSKFVEQNQFGLRGPKTMRKKKSPRQKRTLVLGDSYVWGYGVDQDEVFTELRHHMWIRKNVLFHPTAVDAGIPGEINEDVFVLKFGLNQCLVEAVHPGQAVGVLTGNSQN